MAVTPCSADTLRREGVPGMTNVISLATRKRVFLFQADSPEGMQEWIDALNRGVLHWH
jgi:molybdate-binding protein